MKKKVIYGLLIMIFMVGIGISFLNFITTDLDAYCVQVKLHIAGGWDCYGAGQTCWDCTKFKK